MEKKPIACVILAAGKGTRMKSQLPKVMHQVANKPLVGHVLDSAGDLGAQKVVTVLGPNMKQVESYVKKHPTRSQVVVQKEQLGTGHAVQQAKEALDGFDGIVFVLYGDTPLILPATLDAMAAKMDEEDAAVAVLGMEVEDPTGYGRLVVKKGCKLQKIVEHKDATEAEREITLCNSGVMAVRGNALFEWLERVDNNNNNGEYYLTDVVGLAVEDKKGCIVVEACATELQGINDRTQLAAVDQVLQKWLRTRAMLNGVTLQDPESVYFSDDTQLAQDVIVEPNVYFGPGVVVDSGVTVRAFSHLEETHIRKNAAVGPYARLRPGADVGEEARIGNFVELKKAVVERGAKISHLSYIGDAHVGAYANIGAGTITCNYDGFEKFFTEIGAYSFIGSNTALVAPVEVGEGAMVGAGSTITEDVESDSLSMTRANQLHRNAWAKRFRLKKQN